MSKSCPFQLPVKTEIDSDAIGYNIMDNSGTFVQWHPFKEKADYIVQAINSHEKLVEALSTLKNDFIYRGEFWDKPEIDTLKEWSQIIEQVLKEPEKK